MDFPNTKLTEVTNEVEIANKVILEKISLYVSARKKDTTKASHLQYLIEELQAVLEGSK